MGKDGGVESTSSCNIAPRGVRRRATIARWATLAALVLFGAAFAANKQHAVRWAVGGLYGAAYVSTVAASVCYVEAQERTCVVMSALGKEEKNDLATSAIQDVARRSEMWLRGVGVMAKGLFWGNLAAAAAFALPLVGMHLVTLGPSNVSLAVLLDM